MMIIDRVIEKLSDPQRWTKGELARDAEGNEVGENDPAACSWCLAGALSACEPDYGKIQKTRRYILRAIMAETHFFFISAFNDDDKTTHADVMRVLHTAKKMMMQ